MPQKSESKYHQKRGGRNHTTSETNVAHVSGGNIAAKAMTWVCDGTEARVSARTTSARANTRTEVYNPASWALLKNEAKKCDETVSDVPAKRVRKRNRISDVLVNRICVKRMEQTRKPGKYSTRKESNVDRILGVFVTICAAISSAIVVCRSVATKTLR
jgi:hypothetical protein